MAQTHQGKVAIVTGAGRGLGQAMATGLLSAGAQVVAVDIEAPVLDALQGAARELEAHARLAIWTGDVARDENGDAIVRLALERFGRLDILVNNAGLNLETVDPTRGKLPVDFREVRPADYRRIIEVNAVAPFLLARAAVVPMLAQKWGRIIGVTTSLDTMYRKGMIPYGASKAAHEALLAAMAEELAGTGVTVNVLVPGGAANTRMTASFGAEQAKLISPGVMVKPLLWLTTAAADQANGRRFIGALWDGTLPDAQAAEKCSAPAAWPQLGRQAIRP